MYVLWDELFHTNHLQVLCGFNAGYSSQYMIHVSYHKHFIPVTVLW